MLCVCKLLLKAELRKLFFIHDSASGIVLQQQNRPPVYDYRDLENKSSEKRSQRMVQICFMKLKSVGKTLNTKCKDKRHGVVTLPNLLLGTSGHCVASRHIAFWAMSSMLEERVAPRGGGVTSSYPGTQDTAHKTISGTSSCVSYFLGFLQRIILPFQNKGNT